MISSVRKKVFSVLAITYAFTATNVMANNKDIEEEERVIESSEIQNDARVNPFEDQNFLNIKFENGEELYWSMVNGFSVFEAPAPFGMNEKGLVIETEINERNNSYTSLIPERDTKVKSNDFPSWLLSKYETVEEIKKNIDNISIVKEDNDESLTYFITDKNDSLTIEIENSKPKLV